MGRMRERLKKRLEKNPIEECNRIQQKFFPDLFNQFYETCDPRHPSYIIYPSGTMLGTLYYKYILGISSMRDMTRIFNDDRAVENIYSYLHVPTVEFLPHGVTINDYLKEFDYRELEHIRKDMIAKLIRRKTFNDARLFGKWLVIIDATQVDEGNIRKNDRYLKCDYNKNTDNAKTKYHTSVLEAKIWFGNELIASIGTEPIQNEDGYYDSTNEKMKQDCEINAFKRLAERIKRDYPRLPICLLLDGLYVATPIIEICEKNDWSYIIRYKEGKASSIEKEYQAIPEKNYTADGCEYVNQVIYQDRDVNVLKYTERRVEKGEEVKTEFVWITNITITDKNAKKIAGAGRRRWKIENQGFNRQKNWLGTLGHVCCWNENAQRNHYLMEQIADFIRQLYEYYYLKKNEIEKTYKKISSDLINSVCGLFMGSEDINQIAKELNESVLS